MSTETKKNETLKVFLVEVEIRQEVVVVAASKKEAETLAAEIYEEDYENGNERDDPSCSAYQIAKVGPEHKHTIPWGVSDDDKRRDWTIPEWLAASDEDLGPAQ
jgi:hypothetical protein